jgi:hypothetical protein
LTCAQHIARAALVKNKCGWREDEACPAVGFLRAKRLGDGVGAFFDDFQQDARGGSGLAAALFMRRGRRRA